MDTAASHTPADRFAINFKEMRATMAAEETRKGLAGALQAAILRLLNAIVALLADLRAGRLAAEAPASAPCAASATCAVSAEAAAAHEPAPEGLRGTGAANGERHREYRAAVTTVPPAAPGDAGADRGAAAVGVKNPAAALSDAGSSGTTEGVVATTAEAESTQTLIEPPSAFAAGGCIQTVPRGPYVASPLTFPLRRRVARLTVSDSKNRARRRRGLVRPFCYDIATNGNYLHKSRLRLA
jgi:hypothetical protein